MYFVFEGIDGSGKTTTMTRVKDKFDALGVESEAFFEPTSGPYGVKLRKEKLSKKDHLSLFELDREWNLNNQVLPALEENKIVLQDRYFYSTLVYQIGCERPEFDMISYYEKTIKPKEYKEPDVVFLLDLPAKESISRCNPEKDSLSVYEKESFLKKATLKYYELFMEFENFIKIDVASKSPDSVANEVFNYIVLYMQKKRSLDNIL